MLKSKKLHLIISILGLISLAILSVFLSWTILMPFYFLIFFIPMIRDIIKLIKLDKEDKKELEEFSKISSNQNIANIYDSKIKKVKIFNLIINIFSIIFLILLLILPIYKVTIPLELIPERFYGSRVFEIVDGQYYVTNISFISDVVEIKKSFVFLKETFEILKSFDVLKIAQLYYTRMFYADSIVVLLVFGQLINTILCYVPTYIGQVVDDIKKIKNNKKTSLLYVYETISYANPFYKREHKMLKESLMTNRVFNFAYSFYFELMLIKLLYILTYVFLFFDSGYNPTFQTSLQFVSGFTLLGYILLALIFCFIIVLIVSRIIEKSLIKKINKQYKAQSDNEDRENLSSVNQHEIIIEDAQNEKNLGENDSDDETIIQKALRLEEEGQYGEALKLYKEASAEGIGIADYFIALMYQHGRGVEISEEQYYKYSLAGYEKGCKFSKDNLAGCYEKGIGCKKNISKAIELYTELTKDGDYFSGLKVGSWYVDGVNVKPDYEKALEYLDYAFHSPEEDKDLGLIYHYIAKAYSLKYDATKGEEGYEEIEKNLLLAIEHGSKEAEETLKACKAIHNGNKNKKMYKNNNISEEELTEIRLNLVLSIIKSVIRFVLYVVGALLIYFTLKKPSDDIFIHIVKLIIGAICCSIFSIIPSLRESINKNDKFNRFFNKEYKAVIDEDGNVSVKKNRDWKIIILETFGNILLGIFTTPFYIIYDFICLIILIVRIKKYK